VRRETKGPWAELGEMSPPVQVAAVLVLAAYVVIALILGVFKRSN
jgi:hypothetical protein